ncbi:hypothetical protein [Acinetobacter pittii]|uniref:hypothetical protein n=1 Tax=Acinetobacter pittii TaxID=48296 RepID=UPI00288093E3|nr:hypothetical protein [Acinetobacter pittii]
MNFINILIDKLLSRTPEFRKKNIDKATIEFFGILVALILIFLIWLYYPTFITWMDQPARNNIIPFKLSEIITERVDLNNFQKVGEHFGTYGDSYGSLNTLFSGFAFAILIISLFMQRQELKEQRKELEAQRLEIKESNDIAEAQRKITEQQATLIEQQIKDANVQSFYQLLFKYLEEKNRKVDSLGSSQYSGLHMLGKFIKAFIRDAGISGNFKNISSINLSTIDGLIIGSLHSAHYSTNQTLKKLRYAEYLNFIFNYIHNNKDLGITDNAISMFIAYTSFLEFLCMFCLALALLHK